MRDRQSISANFSSGMHAAITSSVACLLIISSADASSTSANDECSEYEDSIDDYFSCVSSALQEEQINRSIEAMLESKGLLSSLGDLGDSLDDDESTLTSSASLVSNFSTLTDEELVTAIDALAPQEALSKSSSAIVSASQSMTQLQLLMDGYTQAVTMMSKFSSRSRDTSMQLASADPMSDAVASAWENSLSALPASRVRLPNNWGAFVIGQATFGDTTPQGRAKHDFRTTGVTAGVDRRFDDLTIGLSGTLNFTKVETNTGEQKNRSSVASLFGVYAKEDFYIAGHVSYGGIDYETKRILPLSEDVSLSGETDGDYIGYGVAVGYTVLDWNKFTLTGELAYSGSETKIDAYEEAGGSIYDMTIDKQTVDASEGRFSLETSRAIQFKNGSVTPFLRMSALRNFESDAHIVVARFSAAPDAPISLSGLDPDKGWWRIGTGLAVAIGERVSGIVQYNADVLRDDVNLHQVSAALRLDF